MPKKKLIYYSQTFLIHMNSKNQFIQSALTFLGFNSKQDVIEKLYIQSLYDTYLRINKTKGLENEIRDRFIKDFYFDSPYLKKWIQLGVLKLSWEGQVFKNKEQTGRTDIEFFISGLGSFVVECKRLMSASSQYIDEGLYRFINKDYSENENYAGMMGFVVEGDIKSICSSLETKCKEESYFEKDIVSSETINTEDAFTTSHYRKNIEAIHIYHLFYAFNLK